MTNYADSCAVARRSLDSVRPWLSEKFCDDGRYVLTDKGRLAPEIQQKYGDVIAQRRGEMVLVELKAEEKTTGNFFIEDWSNWQRGNPGWFHKLDTDLLFYHFLDSDALYIIHFHELRRWLLADTGRENRLSQYRLVRQGKCSQLNDTWGRLVPVREVMETREVRTHLVYLGVEIGPRIPVVGSFQQRLEF